MPRSSQTHKPYQKGDHFGGLENGAVGIAPFRSLDGLVNQKIRTDLEQITMGLINREIETLPKIRETEKNQLTYQKIPL